MARVGNPFPWAALVLLTPALAGCLGGGSSTDGADDPVEGAQASAGLSEDAADSVTANDTLVLPPWNVTAEACTLLVASVPVTADEARAVLPDGFEPIPYQGVPNTAGAALVVAQCGRALDAHGVEFPNHREVFVYLYVTPPSEYAVEGIELYRFLILHGASNADVQASYAAANHTAATGTATASAAKVGGEDIESVEASAAVDDSTFSFRGLIGRLQVVIEPRTTYRLFTAADGVVTGALDLDLRESQTRAFATATVGAGPLLGAAGPALIVHYDAGAGAAYTVTPVSLSAA